MPLGPPAGARVVAPPRRAPRRRAVRWTAGAGLAVSAMALLLAIFQSGIGAARVPAPTSPVGLMAPARGAAAAAAPGELAAPPPGAVTVVEFVRPRPAPSPLVRPRAKAAGARAGGGARAGKRVVRGRR
jgi:hypothetical protein